MCVSAARPGVVQVVAVQRWPRGCVMRKRRVSTHSYCARYIPIHHTQGSRNRHGWIDQATCLLLRRRRAQAFVRVNQQVSKFYIFDLPRIYVSLTRPRFRRWGVVSFADSLDCVGIISKDVTSAFKLFGSSLSWPPFFQEFFIFIKGVNKTFSLSLTRMIPPQPDQRRVKKLASYAQST